MGVTDVSEFMKCVIGTGKSVFRNVNFWNVNVLFSKYVCLFLVTYLPRLFFNFCNKLDFIFYLSSKEMIVSNFLEVSSHCSHDSYIFPGFKYFNIPKIRFPNIKILEIVTYKYLLNIKSVFQNCFHFKNM